MTAGNLFCGFMAVVAVCRAISLGGSEALQETYHHYLHAICFIFGACVFDLLDGRVARISGQESQFGREFDSIADVISFGLAPALLLLEVVLNELSYGIGELIAFVYLLCGAMRLARFNCASSDPKSENAEMNRNFLGFPIPAAAGLISSITLLMLWLGTNEGQTSWNDWRPLRFILPALMIFLAFMMFSEVHYPSFKKLHWKSRHSVPVVVVAVVIVVCTVRFYHWMPALLFVLYFLYGLFRPWVSRRWRRELGDEDDPEEISPLNGSDADAALGSRPTKDDQFPVRRHDS